MRFQHTHRRSYTCKLLRDPQFRVGTYYIGVYGFDRVDYRVSCTVLSRKSHSSHHSRVSKSTKQRLMARIAVVRDPESRENSELRMRVQEIKAGRALHLAQLEQENAEKQKKRVEEWRLHRAADADRHRLDFKKSSSGLAGTRGRMHTRVLHWAVAIAVGSTASRWAAAAAQARKLAERRRRFSSARYSPGGGKRRRISRSATSIPIEKPAETLGRLRHTNTQRWNRHAERLSDLELQANLKATALEQQSTEKFKDAALRREAFNMRRSEKAKASSSLGAKGVSMTGIGKHTSLPDQVNRSAKNEKRRHHSGSNKTTTTTEAESAATAAAVALAVHALRKIIAMQLQTVLELEHELDPKLGSTLYLVDHDSGAFVQLTPAGLVLKVDDGEISELAECTRSGNELALFNTDEQLLETFRPITIGGISQGVIRVESSVNAKQAWQEGRLGRYIEAFTAALRVSCEAAARRDNNDGGIDVQNENVEEDEESAKLGEVGVEKKDKDGQTERGDKPTPHELVRLIVAPDVDVAEPERLLHRTILLLRAMQDTVKECQKECHDMVISHTKIARGDKADEIQVEEQGGEQAGSVRWKPTQKKKYEDLCKALERYETVKAISFKERMEIMKVRAEAEAKARSKQRFVGKDQPPGRCSKCTCLDDSRLPDKTQHP